MPLYLAQKLCPHLIVFVLVSISSPSCVFRRPRPFPHIFAARSVKLQPDLYVKASREIMTIYEKYGPIAPASLDEACTFALPFI